MATSPEPEQSEGQKKELACTALGLRCLLKNGALWVGVLGKAIKRGE